MDNTERLAILDAKDSDTFASRCGMLLNDELCEWIQLIVSSGPSEEAFDRLNTISWYIFVERQGVAFGEPVRFEVSCISAEFQEFIYKLNVFSTMEVPYREWHSMVDMLFVVLKQMTNSSHLNFSSQQCKTIEEHAAIIVRRLTTDPNYNQRFTDLLNGAL